ncbi:phospholipase A2 inhibitor-like [Pseudonaja textilis]|uniref:phospholipase A2 inhibitor-like n=1 Tax=Pseudonaja textilis TaxID=8673 RepID=UPI000EAA196D|nr:phospholipase A2 inhibitor-like [Pseudonaja textilis]
MRPPAPPLLIACLVMSLNSYTQQVPPCLPQFLGPESFLCNSSLLREFPSGFPSETKSIFVQSAQISNLAADALQGLPELQELFLFNNQMKTLPSGLFRNLPALHFLDLSGNLLEDLPADLFAPVTSLAYLSLSANQLTELRPSWFVTLKELKNLRLDHNQLKEIPPNCFRTLTLVSLDLSSNLLHCLSPEMFQGLTFLEMLNLINNPIVSIAPDTFRGTPTLWVLSLGNNSLTHVPPGLFQSLKNLVRLDLSANEITSLEAPLVNVSSEFTLDLSGNPWACDCRLQALFNWAQEGNVDWLSKENVVCAFPKSLKGKTATSLERSQLCPC